MLDHRLLQTFVAIAESGSFHAASEAVHRTPSAVSMQIKKLEDQLRKPLFERSAHGVRLTQFGEVLLIHARRVLKTQEEALEALVRASAGETVALGIPEEFVPIIMPRLLEDMAREGIDTGLKVLSMPSHELVRRLEEGAVDLAVVTEQQVGDERGDVVMTDRGLWVCKAGSRAPEDNPLPLGVDTEGCVFRRAALEILARKGRPHKLAVVGTHHVVHAAVLSGTVVGLMPKCATTPAMRELTVADGFEPLPAVVLRLRRARRRRGKAMDAVAGLLTGLGRRIGQEASAPAAAEAAAASLSASGA